MPEIAPKEKRAKSSLTAFQAFFGKPCCRQTKYNSTGPKTRSKCEGQASLEFLGSWIATGVRLPVLIAVVGPNVDDDCAARTTPVFGDFPFACRDVGQWPHVLER